MSKQNDNPIYGATFNTNEYGDYSVELWVETPGKKHRIRIAGWTHYEIMMPPQKEKESEE